MTPICDYRVEGGAIVPYASMISGSVPRSLMLPERDYSHEKEELQLQEEMGGGPCFIECFGEGCARPH